MHYIALLRAINVGGHTITMERLRSLFSEMGFENVQSYIQTGNIFFTSANQDKVALTQEIEAHLQTSLGYAVPTFLLTYDDLAIVIEQAPFAARELTPQTRFVLMFLSEPLPADVQMPIISPKGDVEILEAHGHVAYMVWYVQHGKVTGLDFLTKTYKVQTTSRFYHTSQKILAAAEKAFAH